MPARTVVFLNKLLSKKKLSQLLAKETYVYVSCMNGANLGRANAQRPAVDAISNLQSLIGDSESRDRLNYNTVSGKTLTTSCEVAPSPRSTRRAQQAESALDERVARMRGAV